MNLRKPLPRTFYEEKLTGNLYYCLGQFTRAQNESYIFETRFGRKIIPLNHIRVAMTQVNPKDSHYQFKHGGCSGLYQKLARTSRPIVRVP